jgi:hypothetical protein
MAPQPRLRWKDSLASTGAIGPPNSEAPILRPACCPSVHALYQQPPQPWGDSRQGSSNGTLPVDRVVVPAEASVGRSGEFTREGGLFRS